MTTAEPSAAPAPASADLDALEQAARAAIIGEIVTLSPDDLLRLIAAVREADALRAALTAIVAAFDADADGFEPMYPDDPLVVAGRVALSPTEPAE